MSNVDPTIQKQQVIYWLLHNQPTARGIAQMLTFQRNNLIASEPVEFHDDINRDYYEAVKRLLEEEITRHMGIGTDIIREVLEDFNIKEYLSV